MTRWDCRAGTGWGRPLRPPRMPSRGRGPAAAASCREMPRKSCLLLLKHDEARRPSDYALFLVAGRFFVAFEPTVQVTVMLSPAQHCPICVEHPTEQRRFDLSARERETSASPCEVAG